MAQISLNSSMRSNLLSLQQTQVLQDMTQLRLSTGLKVNSAIDNPSNYYTASSLTNRAKDLSSLLDAMSQGIQTIKAASEILTTATKFLEQAKAVAVKSSESDNANNSSININGDSKLNITSENDVAINMQNDSSISINNNSTIDISAKTAIFMASTYTTSKIVLNDNAKINAKGAFIARNNIIINSKNASLSLNTTGAYAFIGSYITAVDGAKIATKSGLFTSNGNYENISLNNINILPNTYFSADISQPAGDPIIPDIDDELKKIFTGDYESKETNEGKQYNSILDQYNQLINDAGYKGINLLLSQNLKINFNEERSSKIDVKGVDASTKGLGLTDAKWKSQTDVQKSLDEISSAINQIRSQSSEFGNFYSVVNSRIDFTDNLINVLTEGSDKLTLADMNESSANMLALQTRQ